MEGGKKRANETEECAQRSEGLAVEDHRPGASCSVRAADLPAFQVAAEEALQVHQVPAVAAVHEKVQQDTQGSDSQAEQGTVSEAPLRMATLSTVDEGRDCRQQCFESG